MSSLLSSNLFAVAPPPTSGVCTIAASASLSDALQINGKLAGLVMPAAWTAAAVTFMGSANGSDFFPIYDALGERTVASADAVAGRMTLFDLADWLVVKYVKVRSGTAATPVTQAAERSITLLMVA